MNIKETLTNILDKVAPKFQFDFIENTDKVANHLIKSEQVIVLPCKLGTTIYHLDLEIPDDEEQCSDCKYNCSDFGEFYCDKYYAGWPSMEQKITHPGDVCPRYKMYVNNITFTLKFYANYEKWFNKTWFLTEEEAYKAIEEYNNETSLSENPS